MKKFYVIALVNPEEHYKPYLVDILESHEESTSGVLPTLDQLRLMWTNALHHHTDSDHAVFFKKFLASYQENEGDHVQKFFRVIARGLEQRQAELIVNAIAASVYNNVRLPSIPNGNINRFRSYDHIYTNHTHIPSFDMATNDGEILADDGRHKYGRYYAYALLDPTTQAIFYVGKGQGGRITDHFRDARNISAVKIAERKRHKLETIKDFLRQGKRPAEMTKILARIETDDDSMLIETFFMKFFFNPNQLENATSGKYHELFRANNDWQIRHGFEIKTETKGSGKRKIQEDLFKGQFLGLLNETTSEIVREAQSLLNLTLVFDEAKISGAGELSRDAVLSTPAGPVLLRLHIRSAHTGKIQTLLVPGGARSQVPQKTRMENLFKSIVPRNDKTSETGNLWLRDDKWFNCESWRKDGASLSKKLAKDRALKLCKLAKNPASLDSADLSELFPVRPVEN